MEDIHNPAKELTELYAAQRKFRNKTPVQFRLDDSTWQAGAYYGPAEGTMSFSGKCSHWIKSTRSGLFYAVPESRFRTLEQA